MLFGIPLKNQQNRIKVQNVVCEDLMKDTTVSVHHLFRHILEL